MTTIVSIEPLGMASADSAVIFSADTPPPAVSQLPTALTEQLAEPLAENARLTAVLDKAVSDVRQFVSETFQTTPAVPAVATTSELPVPAVAEEVTVVVKQPVVDKQSVVVEQPVVVEQTVVLPAVDVEPSSVITVKSSVADAVSLDGVAANRPESAAFTLVPHVFKSVAIPVADPSLVVVENLLPAGAAVIVSEELVVTVSSAPNGSPAVLLRPVAAETPIAGERPVVAVGADVFTFPVTRSDASESASAGLSVVSAGAPAVVGDESTVVIAAPASAVSDAPVVQMTVDAEVPSSVAVSVDLPRPAVETSQTVVSAPVVAEESTPVEKAVVGAKGASPVDVVVSRRTKVVETAEVTPEDAAAALTAAGIAPGAEIAIAAQRAAENVAPVAPLSQPAAAESVLPSQVLVETAQAVADTLIVTPGLLRGQGEVTVQLKGDVLQGAQVTIAVHGKQLEVAFLSASSDVAVLVERNLPQIQEYLGARIASFNVGVKMRKLRG